MTAITVSTTNPSVCPFCNSEYLESGVINEEPINRVVTCQTCKRSWNEIYTCIGIVIPEPYLKVYQENQYITKNCKCGSKDVICPIHEEGYR